ncbi:hypothetical protein ACFYUY_35005 [Kitasatospora sp. NPDC004745]|uniref:hypothetical protein n=1 Tax=Kitasatospora sp. NPDC004745 TaxID=3364019 RepID=UPI0036AC0AAA
MPNTPAAALLADAYTWFSTGLQDLVKELLDDSGLDTANDLVGDLCGELWLHAAEIAMAHGRSFTEILDLLDEKAGRLVNRLRDGPELDLAGRNDTVADPADVAELAADSVDGTGHRPVPRPHRPAATSTVEHLTALRSAA